MEFPPSRLQITKKVLWSFAILPVLPFLNISDLDPDQDFGIVLGEKTVL